jgi:sugar phosphate isomerase/epimerase
MLNEQATKAAKTAKDTAVCGLRGSLLSRREFIAAGTALGAFLPLKMRLSCLPVSFFDAIAKKQLPLESWMDFAAELGLDGVECGPLLIEPLGPAKPDEFRRLAEARGLAVSNFTSYSDFTNPDPEARKREVAAMITNVEIARDLGANSVRALTGQQRPGLNEAETIRWIAESIHTVADKAVQCGLHLNIENHTKAFTWTEFDFAIQGKVFLKVLKALRGVPVGVQFDTANPLVAGEETLPLFEKVHQRIGYVHVNDVRRPKVFEFVTVGTGIAPIQEVLRRLSQRGYHGWVGIEEASRTGRDGVRQAVAFTRNILNSLKKADTDEHGEHG